MLDPVRQGANRDTRNKAPSSQTPHPIEFRLMKQQFDKCIRPDSRLEPLEMSMLGLPVEKIGRKNQAVIARCLHRWRRWMSEDGWGRFGAAPRQALCYATSEFERLIKVEPGIA